METCPSPRKGMQILFKRDERRLSENKLALVHPAHSSFAWTLASETFTSPSSTQKDLTAVNFCREVMWLCKMQFACFRCPWRSDSPLAVWGSHVPLRLEFSETMESKQVPISQQWVNSVHILPSPLCLRKQSNIRTSEHSSPQTCLPCLVLLMEHMYVVKLISSTSLAPTFACVSASVHVRVAVPLSWL